MCMWVYTWLNIVEQVQLIWPCLNTVVIAIDMKRGEIKLMKSAKIIKFLKSVFTDFPKIFYSYRK